MYLENLTLNLYAFLGNCQTFKVSLQTYNGDHFCGGTWVQVGNVSQIVTAAHCVVMGRKSTIAPDLVTCSFDLT